MTRTDYMRNYLRSKFAEQDRYCSECRCKRPRQGGREIVINGGRNARWVCGKHEEAR